MDILNRDKEPLMGKIYLGLVEDNVDPKRIGRLKIRVQSLMEEIKVSDLPWAHPFKDLSGKSFSVPGIGKIVNVIFTQENMYSVEYIYSEKYNINLSDKLESLGDKEYKNFVALLFDHRTQIYSDESELRIDYMFNNIKIKEDSINIHLKDNDQEVRIGHDYASQSAILGDHFLMWMDEFMNTMILPTSMLGNLSAPVLKPQIDAMIAKYFTLRKTFLSQHVKIVDNGMCIDVGENRYSTPTTDDIVEINNEKILDNKNIDKETKDKIKTDRSNENKKVEDNKPNEDDKVSETLVNDDDGDTVENEIIESPVNTENVKLSDKEQQNIDATNNVMQRKGSIKKQNEAVAVNEAYADIWVGKVTANRGSNSDNKESENYGTYTTDTSNQQTTNNLSSNEVSSFGGVKAKEMNYSGKKIINGKLEQSDLVIVEGFKDSKGRNIQLREDAAKSFKRLNDAFKSEFGKNIPINDTYRNYDRQVKERLQAEKSGNPGLAAVPGTSAHGWGLAIDINSGGWGTDIVKWFKNTGSKYGWSQPSSWPYYNKKDIGKNSPLESWHWQYFPDKDRYK